MGTQIAIPQMATIAEGPLTEEFLKVHKIAICVSCDKNRQRKQGF